MPLGAAPSAAARLVDGVNAIVEAAEDHFTGGGLEDAGDGDVDGAGDHLARVIHYYHGAVVQIGDALVVLLAFLKNEDAHGLAGKHDGLERIGQLINVEHFDAVQLRDLVQIEVVGNDLANIEARQLDQLHVDFADVGKVILDDLHLKLRQFLDALQDVQAAAAAVAFQGIGGIGDQLQLTQHELRDYQRAVEEAGFDDVGDTAVDDDAGIENFKAGARGVFAAEETTESGQVEHVALAGAHHQADVRHPEEQRDFEERDSSGALREGAAEDEAGEEGSDDAEYGSDGGPDEPLQSDFPDLNFKEDDGESDYNSDGRINDRRGCERPEKPCGAAEEQNEENAE